MSDDPLKIVATRLWTPEWKSFVIAAKAKGLTIRDAARLAILEWTDDPKHRHDDEASP